MENMKKKDSEWVVAVESSLKGETRPHKSQHGLIHSVPKSLYSRNNRKFYLPQAIFFGPYHFKQEDVGNNDMELLKSEVARKMHGRIIGNGDTKGLKSVVEKFMEKDNQDRIKKSYAKEFKLSSEVCAWMIVRDACFVIEVLNRFREDKVQEHEDEDEDAEESVSPFIDSILSRKRHHPLLTEIVKDMLKMENQLPFWVLEIVGLCTVGFNDDDHLRSIGFLTEEIGSDIVGSNENDQFQSSSVWFEFALKKLSPIEVAERPGQKYKERFHILQLLHDYIVDRQVPNKPKLPQYSSWSYFRYEILDCLIVCLIEEELSDKPATKILKCRRCMKLLFQVSGFVITLLVLSPVLVILFVWGIIFAIWYSIKNYISAKVEEKGLHVPTVEELKRVGVKFKNSDGGKKIGVSDIKFKDSKLYLPKINIDNRSEVILRNLIALEICSQNEQKPITRYALLMNDLVNTSGDVGILRREGIITSSLGSDDEIAQLWNFMVTATEMPRYDSIDKACEFINRYRKQLWKVLWAQFVMLHCSKPWLFLSLLAGVTFLLLTLVQVICLFQSCQLK
ncbi:putative UPF0481 protein At3g02645 [Cryptomeria japonica]|uniref:putative UPF0481 protein At3g02645 n=1 Tax=Cryptomeria japonica TaxID=3369 RepID=UPI0027DA5EB2|nr:putative UPF0481 protein At3g02645 [Cryptomeria japonica]